MRERAATQSFFFFLTTDGFFFPRLEFCHDDETWQAIGKGFFIMTQCTL